MYKSVVSLHSRVLCDTVALAWLHLLWKKGNFCGKQSVTCGFRRCTEHGYVFVMWFKVSVSYMM